MTSTMELDLNNYGDPDQKQGHDIVFEWTLKNFSVLPIYEYSKEICASKKCRMKTLWRTEVHFYESPRKPKTIELYIKLHRTDKRESSIKAEFSILLADNTDEVMFEGACGSVFPSEGSFRSTSVTIWLQNGDLFSLPADEMKVQVVVNVSGCCDGSVFLDELLKANGGKIFESKGNVNLHLSQLQLDFRDALQNELLADVDLCAGKEVIHANKFILAARSPIFRRMFETTEVSNVGFDPSLQKNQALHAFVSYLYTGFSKNVSLNATCSLYSIANAHQVNALQKICGQILFSNVNVNTVCGILKLANRHKDAAMKEATMHFIGENLGQVKSTPYWESLVNKYPNLYAEVCHFLKNLRSNYLEQS